MKDILFAEDEETETVSLNTVKKNHYGNEHQGKASFTAYGAAAATIGATAVLAALHCIKKQKSIGENEDEDFHRV